MFWILLAYLSKSYLIFIASLTVRQREAELLAFFYPHQTQFYWGLALGLPAVLLFLLSGFREKLWQQHRYWPFALLLPLCYCALYADLVNSLIIAFAQKWAFSWSLATQILICCGLLWWLHSSKHMRLMQRDWRRH